MSLRESTIATVGSGVMAEAMIAGLLRAEQVAPDQIIASHPRAERRSELISSYGIRTVEDNASAVEHADVVVLAIKPQMLVRVGRELDRHDAPGQLVISIIAGATTQGAEQRPGPPPDRAQHAQHAGPARPGHDRLVRHAGGHRCPAGAGARAAQQPGHAARGRRREARRHGDRGQRHRARPTSSWSWRR